MAQFVMKLHGDANGIVNPDLAAYLSDYRGAANSDPSAEIELRVRDAAEAEAFADQVAAYRDALGITERISYHLCRHDEGVGFCTGVVEK
jgi:pimeloyl-ACP methyl ester carboxylesterase